MMTRFIISFITPITAELFRFKAKPSCYNQNYSLNTSRVIIINY